MRLICHNCGAQYEVADALIPPEGRDVECSNCTYVWFETPPDQPIATAARTDPAARRPLDTEVAEILREEAAREEATRHAEAQAAVEAQPDLGLDDLPGVSEAATRAGPGQAATQADETATAEAAQTGDAAQTPGDRAGSQEDARLRDQNARSLPKASADQSNGSNATVQDQVAAQTDKPKGFALGFIPALIVLAMAALAYIYPDQITDRLPGLQEPLDRYGIAVDQARLWLDAWVDPILARVTGSP